MSINEQKMGEKSINNKIAHFPYNYNQIKLQIIVPIHYWNLSLNFGMVYFTWLYNNNPPPPKKKKKNNKIQKKNLVV